MRLDSATAAPALTIENVAIAVDPAAVRDHPASSRFRASPFPLSILEAWHLFSLDAPTVAALWSCFFARAMRIDLPWHAPLVLFLGAWLIYIADRLLDGFRPNHDTRLERRHLFHLRHARAFLFVAAIAGSVLLWLIRYRMLLTARHEDTLLFLIALLYLLLVHISRAGGRKWLPKEMAVGIVFAAACAVPAWSRLAPGHLALLPGIAIFAALCWLNCVAIERWENPPGRSDNLQAAHITTRWTANHFSMAALTMATLSGCLAIAQATYLHGNGTKLATVSLAGLTTASLLAMIDYARARLSPTALRIAADLALLTPLLWLPALV